MTSDTLTQQMLRIISKELQTRNPYPIDIFPDPTPEEFERMRDAFTNAGLYPDKFFAWFGRRVWNNACDEINKIAQEETP